MESLYIEPTEFTPLIDYNPIEHTMEISGFSRPEDVRRFYQIFFNWIENNEAEIQATIKKNTELKLKFELIYFNSASSKCLLDMVILLKKVYSGKLNVIWYYEEGDEDLLDAGEEFSDAVEIPFNFIETEE